MPKHHRHGRFNDAPSIKPVAGGISGSRLVVGNPNGNRAERRANAKLTKKTRSKS